MVIITLVVYFRTRRVNIVSDIVSIKRLVEGDHIGKYKKIYVTPKVLQKVEMMSLEGGLKVWQLKPVDISTAENIAFTYGVNTDIAELFVLCEIIRAKTFLTNTDLPDELVRRYWMINIVSVE